MPVGVKVQFDAKDLAPLFERIGLWARGKSAGVSETSFCGLQRERGRFGLAKGGRSDNAEKGAPIQTLYK